MILYRISVWIDDGRVFGVFWSVLPIKCNTQFEEFLKCFWITRKYPSRLNVFGVFLVCFGVFPFVKLIPFEYLECFGTFLKCLEKYLSS